MRRCSSPVNPATTRSDAAVSRCGDGCGGICRQSASEPCASSLKTLNAALFAKTPGHPIGSFASAR